MEIVQELSIGSGPNQAPSNSDLGSMAFVDIEAAAALMGINPDAAGKTIRNGAGAPSNSLGVDGDFYVDTTNTTWYGPKAAGVWPVGIPLKGVKGADGTNGTNGTNGIDGEDGPPGDDGKTILSGAGAPADAIGTNGDFYYDTAATTLYGPKTANTWSPGTSLKGADGADGNDGKSAYQVALDNGFVGTEAQWLASLEAAVDTSDFLQVNVVGGNVDSVQGADNLKRKLINRRLATALVCGDSITAYSEVVLTVQNVVDNGDGTATVTRSSGHGVTVGQPVRMVAAPTANLNVMEAPVLTTPSTTEFTYATGGRTHGIVSLNNNPNVASMTYPYRRGARGWFSWMESFLGESFDTTWCAVPGATATDISALIDVTPMADVADVGFLCLGMNDVYAKGLTFATIQTNMQALIDKIRARCNHLVILTVPPRGPGDVWTAAKMNIHLQVNRWLYTYGRKVGALVVDTWRAIYNNATYVNPAAANPDPDVNFIVGGSDQTHPSSVGAFAIGRAVANVVAPLTGVSGWKPAHAMQLGSNSNNLLNGSDFFNASATPGVAEFWTLDTNANLTLVPSLVPRTVATDGDACGNNQVFTLAVAGGATGTFNTRFRRNGIQARVTAGQTVQFKMRVSVKDANALMGLEIALFGTMGSHNWIVSGHSTDSNTKSLSGEWTTTITTAPAVVPAGITNLDCWLRPYVTGDQTSPLTIKTWHPELIVVG